LITTCGERKSVTVAPATIAPSWSCTVPLIELCVFCANEKDAARQKTAVRNRSLKFLKTVREKKMLGEKKLRIVTKKKSLKENIRGSECRKFSFEMQLKH
jgi:hypothetical protein